MIRFYSLGFNPVKLQNCAQQRLTLHKRAQILNCLIHQPLP